MSSIITGLLGLLAKAGFNAILDQVIPPIVSWWIDRQKDATLSEINDAIVLLKSSQSDEDRYKAMDALHAAISRPRVSE